MRWNEEINGHEENAAPERQLFCPCREELRKVLCFGDTKSSGKGKRGETSLVLLYENISQPQILKLKPLSNAEH